MVRLSRAQVIVASLFGLLLSCGGGSGGCGGCGGCGDGSYMFPLNDPNRPDVVVQNEAMRARITQSFIDFIKPQLPDVIRAMFDAQSGMRVDNDGVLHVAIGDADLVDLGFVAEIKIRDAEALIWLDDLEQRFDIQFEQPNGVRITMQNLRFGLQMDLREDVAGTTSSCPLEGNLGPFGPGPLKHAAEISINMLLEPGVGPDPDRFFDFEMTIDDIEINDLDVDLPGSSVYCMEPECEDCLIEIGGSCYDPGGRCAECQVFCGAITNALVDLVTALLDFLNPVINGVLQPVVNNFVQDALADLNNTPAKMESLVNLKDITGLDAFAASQGFGIFISPEVGKFPVIDRGNGDGMEVTVTGAAEAQLAECIPATPPFNEPKGPIPILGATDSQGRPYMVGMTLAQALLNQMLDAVHRSGSLCLKLSSQDVRDLTGGTFTLNASLLSLLASDLSKLASDTAPVIIELKPRTAPFIDLGSGALTGQDAMGNDVYDWLLKLTMDDLGVAFHVFIQDRYVRIFEVTSDVFVGLNIVVLPDNNLQVALGELRIDDFTETFNEALPNADFAMVLPTLLDVALQALVGELTFDLDVATAVSDALNGAPVFMHVNEIIRDGVQEDYLTLRLTFNSTTAAPWLSLSAETVAKLHEDDALHTRKVDGIESSGRVRLAVGEGLSYTTQMALEYQVRVDKGMWSVPLPARPDGTIMLEDRHLVLPGQHEIEVRARYKDNYTTLDASPARVLARVDPVPPRISAWIEDELVHVVLEDDQAAAEALTVKAQIGDKTWFDVRLNPEGEHRAAGAVPLGAVGRSADEMRFEGFDDIGNSSGVATLRVGLEGGPPAVGCGCSDVDSTGDSNSLALAALGALFLWARRRRKR